MLNEIRIFCASGENALTVLTDTVVISLIGAAATVAVSMVNAFFGYIGAVRGRRNEEHLLQTKESVAILVTQTNGIQERLLKVTGESERAKGVKEAEDAAACRYKAPDDSCKFPKSEEQKK